MAAGCHTYLGIRCARVATRADGARTALRCLRLNQQDRSPAIFSFFFSSRRRHTRLQGDWEFRRVLFRSLDVQVLVDSQRATREAEANEAAEASRVRAEIDETLAGLPNLPAEDVPDGPDETANRVLRHYGE